MKSTPRIVPIDKKWCEEDIDSVPIVKIISISTNFRSIMEHHDSHELRLELENVQSVIQLTKENIDALNDRFKKFNPPPRIYLDEYNDLTTKLHHLKSLEQSLVDKISALYEQQQEVSAFICIVKVKLSHFFEFF